MVGGFFADVYFFRIRPGEVEETFIGQIVVDDDVSLFEDVAAF